MSIEKKYNACVHVYMCVFKEARLTVSPRGSPLSADTLSATAMADILRGWVQIMLQNAPRPDSISDSNIYWGSWVVLPHPLSPDITITYQFNNLFRISEGNMNIYNFHRNLCNKLNIWISSVTKITKKKLLLQQFENIIPSKNSYYTCKLKNSKMLITPPNLAFLTALHNKWLPYCGPIFRIVYKKKKKKSTWQIKTCKLKI